MGPHFQKGKNRIGRDRLPAGHVAILNDQATLQGAITELWEYGQSHQTQPLKIVFRVCSEGERQAYMLKLREILGVQNYIQNLTLFALPDRSWHIIDSEHIAHARVRHSDPKVEQAHGHIAVQLNDFNRVPDVINPRNIVSFEYARGQPRIVYNHRDECGLLVVVQELRTKTGMVFKTLYKKR